MSTNPAPAGNEPLPPRRGPGRAGLRWLAPLAAALIVVECSPLLLMGLSRGIWPLNNFEDFSTAFWAPVKVGYVPSYYFNPSGFYFGGILKLVHGLTDWAAGSKVVTYRHLQLFGYVARTVFALATLGIVAIYWRRRRDTVSVATAAALLLALRLGAPFIVRIYDMRVGLQLSYVLVMLLIALATLEAMGRFLDGESPGSAFLVYSGALSGATLFEAPHYLPFFLPLFAVAMFAPGSVSVLGGRVGRWAGGAVLGATGALVALYGFDYRSALAAAFSNFRGIVVGFPQPQPGFEKFTSWDFDTGSDYFLIKVAIAIQVAVLLAFAATLILSWRRRSRRYRYAALVILASFAAIWLVHLRIWRTHGSYTTVFSVVYFGFLSMAIVLETGWRSLELGDRTRATALAVAGAAAGLIAPCVATLWQYPYWNTYSSDRAFGESFRSFNAFLDRLPGPVGFVFNDNITYFPLIAHCNFSQIMYHMGSTVGFADVRFSERIQADRYPNYRLVYFFRIISAKYHWGAAHLDAAVDQGIPALDVPTELVPISQAEVARRCAALETQIPCVPVDAIPPGEEPAGFMAKHPESGLRRVDYGNMQWSILPIAEPSVRDAMLNDVWPPRWSRQGRGYYLVATPLGYYLLGLAVPGASK